MPKGVLSADYLHYSNRLGAFGSHTSRPLFRRSRRRVGSSDIEASKGVLP